MTFEVSVKIDTEAFEASVESEAARYEEAFSTAKNMIQSMLLTETIKDVSSAGAFGSRTMDEINVTVDGDTITTTVGGPGASLFETGGVIHGNPLLWLPISGTDAVGTEAKDYPGGLFSVNRKAGGPPLLFSIAERAPRYFGIASVNVPKKFHIEEIQQSVMANFKEIFQTALGAAK